MPVLGAPLDFAKLEARNLRGHQLGSAPASPVTGQLYYNTADNTLYWYDGTAWVSARGGSGSVPDATASTKGVIMLAGDLAGTAASPQIAAGVITDAEVAAANKDGAVGVASMRTIGTGALQAMAGNRSLDTITAPAGALNMNGQKITNMQDPLSGTDGATRNYVDQVAQGLDAKASVKAASTANLTLSGTQTVDGVALVAADRVLVKDQTTPSANGIYSVQAGAWIRTYDMDAWSEVPGSFVFVEQGTVNADTGWVSTADAGGTLGTTNITWTQFSGAGQVVAGAGLTKTGNSIDIGGGIGIQILADNIQIDGTVAKRYTTATHGAGTTITITAATHGCGATRGLLVQVRDEATGAWELPDIVVAATGDVTVTYAASVAANSKRVIIVG